MLALTTNAMAFPEIKIVSSQRVPTNAFRFLGIYGGMSDASKNIFLIRDGFSMKRIRAHASPTKMVQCKTFWNRTSIGYICESMGHHHFSVKEKSIAFRMPTGDPIPAGSAIPHRAVFIDLAEKTGNCFSINCGDGFLFKQDHVRAAPTAIQPSPVYGVEAA